MTQTTEKVYSIDFVPAQRDWFQPSRNDLTEIEWIMLSRLIFDGGISPSHPDKDARPSEKQIVALDSLTRFGFAQPATLLVNKSRYGVLRGWIPTDAGRESFLDRTKPQRYGCLCEHALRLGCVCSERTYCPNPEHFDNGCHGNHD